MHLVGIILGKHSLHLGNGLKFRFNEWIKSNLGIKNLPEAVVGMMSHANEHCVSSKVTLKCYVSFFS